jgi:hypothetical protein
MNSHQRSFFFNVDWITVLIYLALCVIGWFNIHAAVFDENHPSILDFDTQYGKQFIYHPIGHGYWYGYSFAGEPVPIGPGACFLRSNGVLLALY